MTSRHLVDPELSPILDQLPAVELTAESLPQLRAVSAQMFERQRPLLPAYPDIAVSEHRFPGPAGAPDVRGLLYRPTNLPQPLPALLWIHGGGYVMGSADQAEPEAKRIVAATGCAVLAVDYRLAPETPFPGPLEDCYAALQWLHASAAELGVDPGRLAVGGSSAGGGLAASLGQLARDRGAIPLVFQLLVCPMLDDRTVAAPDPHPYAGEFMWTRDANRFGWTALLGREPGGADGPPYAAAARAERLEGLPPAYICVGALDLFLEEDLEYARRLIRAGVPTELHVYPGAYHGFMMTPAAQVTQAYVRDSMHALRRALNPTTGAR